MTDMSVIAWHDPVVLYHMLRDKIHVETLGLCSLLVDPLIAISDMGLFWFSMLPYYHYAYLYFAILEVYTFMNM